MKKNVIVFFTDQQRWDTMKTHNNPMSVTPNLDRMACLGTDVHYAFTCQPVCGPARSVMQTGLYPTTTGCWRNGIPLPRESKTLAHYFKENGYRTAYIGKWHLGSDLAVCEVERGGYQDWLACNLLEFTSDPYHTVLYNENREAVRLPGYRVDALCDQAIRYINLHQNEPFFLFLSFLEPHHQNHVDAYPAPEIYAQRFSQPWLPPDLAELQGSAHRHISGYYGMCNKLDEAYGRLQDALKSLNIQNETIVLFTTDHGCHFKTRNEEYKRSGHESSIRIPCVFTGAEFNGAGRINELVSLIDLPPTLLDAVGITPPETWQGKSIMPLIRRQQVDWQKAIYVQISESQIGRAIRTKRWKYIISAPVQQGKSGKSAQQYTEEALYDLEHDSYELDNLVGLDSHRAIADELLSLLRTKEMEIGEGSIDVVLAEQRDMGQRRVSILDNQFPYPEH
jgi:arylsulfatase A-like enzyme